MLRSEYPIEKSIWEYFPKYCKHEGKVLKDGKEIKKIYFSESTGIRMHSFVRFRYCDDWQKERTNHTEYWGSLENEPCPEPI